MILALAPLILIPLGGLIGGAIGAAATAANIWLARRPTHPLLTAVIMIIVVGFAFVAYALVAAAITNAIEG